MHSGGSFKPEDISLLRSVLDDAFADIPTKLRVSKAMGIVGSGFDS